MIAQNGDSHLSVVAVAELMEMFTQMALGRIFLNMQMRGAPSHGTMFVAGETGAEIVGHINGKTEVLRVRPFDGQKNQKRSVSATGR